MPYALADDIVATIDHIQITRSELQKHMNQSYGEEEAEALLDTIYRINLKELICFKVIEDKVSKVKVNCTPKDYTEDMDRYEAPFFEYYLQYGLAHLERWKKELYPFIMKNARLKQERGTWIEMLQTKIIRPEDKNIFLDVWKQLLENKQSKNELRKLVFKKYSISPAIFKDRIRLMTKFRKNVEKKLNPEEVAKFAEKEKFALADGVVHIQHIFLKTYGGKSEQEVLAKIQKIAREIQPDLSNFSECVTKYSEDLDSKFKGGSLGWVPRWTTSTIYSAFLSHIGWIPHPTVETLKEVVQAGYSLPLQQVSQPIKTKYGYHLVVVKQRQEGKNITQKELIERARNMMTMLKMDELLKKWLNTAKVDIKI